MIPTGFYGWLSKQRTRQDETGALARRVASGQVSLYRPDDSRVIPPGQLRSLIARAESEFARTRTSASRTRQASAPSTAKRCKGCGAGPAPLTVRAAGGTEHWHHDCRNNALGRRQPADSIRSTGMSFTS